jgi:hypothetical protein
LHRHADHIPAALVKAREATEIADAGTLLSRVEALVSRCERIYDGAMEEGEWAGAVGATRELRGCLELLAKMSGELQPTKISLNNINVHNLLDGLTLKDLSDQELEFIIDRLSPGSIAPETVRSAPLFDEVTLPLPSNVEACRAHREILRGIDVAQGKPPRGWESFVTSGPEDRLRMLFAAWMRETGEDLSDAFRMADLGETATIEIEFDLKDGSRWPRVRLVGLPQPGSSGESLILPAGTIQGVR